MRRLLVFLPLAFVLVAFVLAACGGSTPAGGGRATGNTPMQTDTGQTTTTAPGY